MNICKWTLLGLMFLSFGFTQAQAAWWVPILSCDGGAARIEVDLAERRNVQIVIASKQIRDYLNSIGVSDFYHSDFIAGRVQGGIFHSSQFSGFVRGGGSAPAYGGSVATVKVYRVEQGLKLTANQEAGEYCWEMDSGGVCYQKSIVPYRDLGNWYFQDCQEIPIAP